jgi:hypothetical protein
MSKLKEQIKDLVLETNYLTKNHPFPDKECTREWQAAETISKASEIITVAIEHIESYDDGMAGWLDDAREFLA